jgi:hypothetical protein
VKEGLAVLDQFLNHAVDLLTGTNTTHDARRTTHDHV